ncbi:Cysteine-rich secretory protein family protein [Rubripirellula amarantea]|uniref:Cysteine-rich secretory protein family protein n=1 Tax=Rubripirellula amarantea TaxID=2527999 RepID=A0A5C5WGU7_9BACT|nr:CAP domain-containing protein [Rubripirellula amarantea]TWT49325.1 Cysteine-rich secretory protein family protein [Rubripirellula amarantea]
MKFGVFDFLKFVSPFALTACVVVGHLAIATSYAADLSKSADSIAAIEDAIVSRTNEYRQSKDLDKVQVDTHLKTAAKQFAEFMARTGKYGHEADGSTPAKRAKAAGYDYCVVRENIAFRKNTNEPTSEKLIAFFVDGWIDSPPHRKNILADYVTETGVGVATDDGVTYYGVQLFGRPRSAAYQLELTNESEDPKTLVLNANDQKDTLELPPRTVLKITRCFPTEVSLQGSDHVQRVASDLKMTISDEGFSKTE